MKLSKATKEIRHQLGSDKRQIGFFFGAGTSMAAGLPGIPHLNILVRNGLKSEHQPIVDGISAHLGKSSTIEHVLNRVRTIRELIGESDSYICEGIVGRDKCAELDRDICNRIAAEVKKEPASLQGEAHKKFAEWLAYAQSHRQTSIEVFTTNYDTLLESAFETARVPYFDGFVGSVEPFFMSEAVNLSATKDFAPPNTWVRLWKLHGSINWCWRTQPDGKSTFTRKSADLAENEELMIFPSKDKYIESRRLPFISFQDRLREFMSRGEVLVIICGYSFQDEHINEIIFEALRANKRLAITALMYGDASAGSKVRKLTKSLVVKAANHPNFTIIGPDCGKLGSTVADWEFDNVDPHVFDALNRQCDLGDFNAFVNYLSLTNMATESGKDASAVNPLTNNLLEATTLVATTGAV